MPVLPLVESSRICPGVSLPARRASATIRAAARSLTDPPGLYHSALPQSSRLGLRWRSRGSASSGNRGVLPIPASRASPLALDVALAGEGHCDDAEPASAGGIDRIPKSD